MPRLVFTLKDLDQATAPRHMRQGSLITSQNTRSTKTGPRRKRRGFARQAISTFSFPTYQYPTTSDSNHTSASSTMTELSPGGVMFRDANENIWARSADGATAYYRGEHRRCGVTARDTGIPSHKVIKPLSLAVGTQTWTFALAGLDSSAAPTAQPSYLFVYLTVEDAGGNIIWAPNVVLQDGTSICNYAAAYHPGQGKVYLFTVYRNTVIRVLPITVSTVTPGAQATYRTLTAGKWNCIDAIYDTATAKVTVVASSWNEAAAGADQQAVVEHSTLDTATNGQLASVKSEDSDPGITGIYLCSGVSWLSGQPFTDAQLRYVYWVKSASAQSSIDLNHVTISTVDLSTLDKTTLITRGATRYTLEHAGVCSGYYDQASGKSVVLSQLIYPATADEETADPTGVGVARNATLERVVFDPSIPDVDFDTAGPGSWLGSKPFQGADSNWYVVTGVDSGTDGFERAYHVRRLTEKNAAAIVLSAPGALRVVAQLYWPDAAFTAHRWRGQLSAFPETINNSWGWTPPVTSAGKVALGRTGDTPQDLSVSVVTVDFAAAFSRGVEIYDDLVLYPGGVPTVAGPHDEAHDLTPLLFPVGPPRIASAGSSTDLQPVLVTTSFRFRDSSGRITRSTTYPTQQSLVFKSSGTRQLAVRNLCHIGRGAAEIELWASVPGGASLHLQAIYPNNPSVLETTLTIDPAYFRSDTETLPAAGDGVLLPNPPPPCRVVAMHADRLFLSGTPAEGEFLFSQPLEPGYGPEFNIEALTQTWLGQGPINAISPVDLNSLALFRPQQIGVVQGQGPTGAGGAFGTMLALNTAMGISAVAGSRGVAVSVTPMGAVFQDTNSGRLAVVTPGLRVDEMPPGVEDAAQASALVAVQRMESEGTVWLQFGSGATAVIDLRHPDEGKASQWGSWHLWTSSALTESASVGAIENASGPLWLQANGSWRTYKTTGQLFQDTNAASAQVDVLMSMSTKLMPDGHHGECLFSDLQVLGTYLSASSVRIATTNDAGTPENHDVTLSDPFNYSWRPGNLLRDQECLLTISEQAGSTGEGFEIDSFGVEFQPAGRMKRLATGKII